MKISLFIKVKNVVHLKNMKKVVLLRLVVIGSKTDKRIKFSDTRCIETQLRRNRGWFHCVQQARGKQVSLLGWPSAERTEMDLEGLLLYRPRSFETT